MANQTICDSSGCESNKSTTEELAPFNPTMILASSTILIIIIVMALFGNSLVIAAFAAFHKLRNVTSYFIVSLAVAGTYVLIFKGSCRWIQHHSVLLVQPCWCNTLGSTEFSDNWFSTLPLNPTLTLTFNKSEGLEMDSCPETSTNISIIVAARLVQLCWCNIVSATLLMQLWWFNIVGATLLEQLC